jgi:hypothetical protein
MPLDDDIAAARLAVSELLADDERVKVTNAQLDYVDELLRQAREVARDAQYGAGSPASELMTRARAALDLAVLLTTDPPKSVSAPVKRTSKKGSR